MVKEINDLNLVELKQLKRLYTKYFLEEAKITQLGFPLLYELITKRRTKVLVDEMLERINYGEFLGFAFVEDEIVKGFITGCDANQTTAIITEAYVPHDDSRVSMELYKKIAISFKNRGKKTVTIEKSFYDEIIMRLIIDNDFEAIDKYQDGYALYEKHL